MKIKVDDALHPSLFGKRAPRPDQVRYYYNVPGYDCLVLVVHGEEYAEAIGKVGAALFNFDTVRGDLICDLFPKAPASWRTHDALVQCTLRFDLSLRGRPRVLSEAVRHHLGDGC